MDKLKKNKAFVKVLGFITYFLIFYFFTFIILGVAAIFIKPLYNYIDENISYAYVVYPMFSLLFLIPFYACLSEDERKKTINYRLKYNNYEEFINFIDSRAKKLKFKKIVTKGVNRTIYYGFSFDKTMLKCIIFFKFKEIKSNEEIEVLISKAVNSFLKELEKTDSCNKQIACYHNYSFAFWAEKENEIFKSIPETYYVNKRITRHALTMGISNAQKKIYIFNPVGLYDIAIYRDFKKLLNLKKKDKLD